MSGPRHRLGAVADPSTYRPASGRDPHRPGCLPLPRRRRPGHLRRQGQEPALAAVVVLPGHRRLHPRTASMVTHRRQRRVDRGRHRGRGAPAGVLLDQGVRPAVQRQVPRRQVLPLARGHHRRGVPAGAWSVRGAKKQGHPLLRALRPRLGDPRDASTCCCGSSRCAPARRACSSAPARSAGRACSATSTSAPPRASGGSTAERAPRDRRRLLRLHGRQHRGVRPPDRDARCTPPSASWTSSGPPGCATTSAPSSGRSRSRPSSSATAPTPT